MIHEWYETLLKGEANGRRSIANATGLDERYVARILDCAFLAPYIVGGILQGHQSPDLTLEKLRGGMPLAWCKTTRGSAGRLLPELMALIFCSSVTLSSGQT